MRSTGAMRFTPADPAQRPSQSSWLAGIAIAAVPVFTAAPASALSFSFSYINNGEPILSGLITGLADNTDSQTGPPVGVTVTSGPAQTLGTYTFRSTGNINGFEAGDLGFSTSNGDLTLKELPRTDSDGNRLFVSNLVWTGFLPSPTVGAPPLGFLRFARLTSNEVPAPLPFGFVSGIWAPVLPTRILPLPEGLITGVVRFEPVADPTAAEVPGPLPLLGAAAAFAASRRLRRRIQGAAPAVQAPARED